MFQLYLQLPAFMLVLTRVSGLMLTAPVFGSRSIPIRIKALFAVAMTAMIFPLVGPKVGATLTLGTALVGLVGELMIGLIMGLSLTLVFTGVQLGGLMIGQQAGIALAQVFNPVFESQSSIVGELMFFVMLMIFLAVHGDQALVEAMMDSFTMIPLLGFGFGPEPVELLVGVIKSSYGLALKVSGPALITLFLTSMSMGLISRTMPQMNILAVGFVIRVIAAMSAMFVTFSLIGVPIVDHLIDAFDQMRLSMGLD